MERSERLAGLLALTSATSIQVLNVRHFKPSLEAGDQSRRVSSSFETDQVAHSFGLGGLLL